MNDTLSWRGMREWGFHERAYLSCIYEHYGYYSLKPWNTCLSVRRHLSTIRTKRTKERRRKLLAKETGQEKDEKVLMHLPHRAHFRHISAVVSEGKVVVHCAIRVHWRSIGKRVCRAEQNECKRTDRQIDAYKTRLRFGQESEFRTNIYIWQQAEYTHRTQRTTEVWCHSLIVSVGILSIVMRLLCV